MEEGSVWTVVLGSNPRAFRITPAQRRLWWTGKVAPGQTFQKGAAANRSCQSQPPLFSPRGLELGKLLGFLHHEGDSLPDPFR